jgi:hypothetical protein
MRIDGRCHCGQIAFEAEANPESVTICHCTDCQRLTGSAFRVFLHADSADFAILSGRPRGYVKTAESGSKRRHAFCGDCGTPIFSCAVESPHRYSLRIGTITQRNAFSPQRQIWRRSALGWIDNIGAVPAAQKG